MDNISKKTDNDTPLTIAVFDSGVGGLTVARALLAEIPGMQLRYFGDTAHVPYGPRPLVQVRDFALQIIEFLIAQQADAVVMGCNMSSASGAHEAARTLFSVPVFEVILPGSKAAKQASKNSHIGVIATEGTVKSGVYRRTLQALGVEKVYEQACPAFVPLIERGLVDGPEVEAAVAEYLTPLHSVGIDTLVFGCTHYPLLRQAIANFLGDDVTLIDPGEYCAREVSEHFSTSNNSIISLPSESTHQFFSSGDPENLRREGEKLLGLPLHSVTRVALPVEGELRNW